jgi:hypothetical protein
MRCAPRPFVHGLLRCSLAFAGACTLLVATPLQGRAQDAPAPVAMPPDPNGTRLFFGPTGRALPKGGGYAGLYVIFPFVQVGVTDRVSIGGGTPLFLPLTSLAVWLTPKVQVLDRPSAQASIGCVHVISAGADDGGQAGVGYGVATFGSDRGAVTIGAGWNYIRSTTERHDGAIVMVGAERRVGRHTKLISENYVSRDVRVAMVGVRLIGDRFSGDFAMVVVPVDGTVVAFPMLNLVRAFGTR